MSGLVTALASGAALAVALAAAPAALADSSQSSNWAGYAVHRSGISFRTASGTWVQPHANCTPGTPGYSSVWVGIGGFSTSSQALEQIGTELDCTASGREVSTAWYELVPAASHTVRLTIDPGDRVRASVTIAGTRVRLSIDDLTRHRALTRTRRASVLDAGSAEWIVEAPSECAGDSNCRTLPLADFGSAAFTTARAQSATGHSGSIADAAWTTTRITLAETGRRFIGYGAGTGTGAQATPSALAAGGRGFTVTYAGGSSTTAAASPGTASPGTGSSSAGSGAATTGGVTTGGVTTGGVTTGGVTTGGVRAAAAAVVRPGGLRR